VSGKEINMKTNLFRIKDNQLEKQFIVTIHANYNWELNKSLDYFLNEKFIKEHRLKNCVVIDIHYTISQNEFKADVITRDLN